MVDSSSLMMLFSMKTDFPTLNLFPKNLHLLLLQIFHYPLFPYLFYKIKTCVLLHSHKVLHLIPMQSFLRQIPHLHTLPLPRVHLVHHPLPLLVLPLIVQAFLKTSILCKLGLKMALSNLGCILLYFLLILNQRLLGKL